MPDPVSRLMPVEQVQQMLLLIFGDQPRPGICCYPALADSPAAQPDLVEAITGICCVPTGGGPVVDERYGD